MVIKRLLKLILLLIVFLTPLIGYMGEFGYEQGKVLFFILAVILAGGVWVWGKKGDWRNWGEIKIAALFFILTLGITSLFGLNPEISIFGSYPYFQGWILYLMLFLFTLMVSDSGLKLKQIGIFLTASAVIVSLFAVKDYIGLTFFQAEIPTYAGRVVSTFGQPNFYAGFLLLTLPFLLRGRLGRWRILWGLIIVVGILISGSRIAICLMILVLAFWLSLKFLKSLKWLFLGGVIFLVIFLAAAFRSGFFFKEIFEPKNLENIIYIPAEDENSVEKRYYLWPLYWKIVEQSPLWGFGLENITSAHQKYFKDNNHEMFEIRNQPSVIFRLRSLIVDRTHNYILDLLMFSGVFGLLAWGLLVCLMIAKVKSKTLLATLLIYLVWSAFQNQSIVQLLIFWLIVGFAGEATLDIP